ncbi:CpaF family protein [Pseudidiomarina woesei]|uniref:Pilus assembly protein, ATPase of CpaF family n=1 Tax=Pseudidiomarina woesei TaxID=1381080 RepID=A0A0K6HBZ0_9GAMM|nr:CpaF family protein [Pseudidiomarina woesei]CUA88397.1 Pilus assembly protein, ATPase of CpaF family [Pseudidiomarina woesei]
MVFNKEIAHELLKQALQRSEKNIEQMNHTQLMNYATKLIHDYWSLEVQQQTENWSTLVTDIVNDCVGFGPLSTLLDEPNISEIMVNRYDLIFVEQNGQLSVSDKVFKNEAELIQVIDRIITPLGRRLDSSQPMVDARMPDGSRINAVLSPVALNGSCLTVRKFLTRQLQFAELVNQGSLSESAVSYLQKAIGERRNILIAGGTGTGKTTLLNTLASHINPAQRLVTIEDAAELRLTHSNLIALEARPANAEGRGAIAIRDLLVNALRMRPDRIIIGECRGAEAIDMLQAMNTGHEGSLTTLHANTARDALQRLEVMVLMAGFDMPLMAIRQQIASAIDVIVQIQRQSDGRRVVAEICEVTGIDAQVIQLSQMFVRRQTGLENTGVLSEWH